MEPFVVKQYSEDERPMIKGNGFDGLEIGQDREEAERFVAFVNAAVAAERERWVSRLRDRLSGAVMSKYSSSAECAAARDALRNALLDGLGA